MAAPRERIGFIGLGSMGRPMATSLVRKRFPVAAFDTIAAHIATLVERGADSASDLASLVSTADVIITMLPNTPDVASVVGGPGGLLETGRAGMLMIDMSTIDPAASRSFGASLAKRRIQFMDAAVGRSPDHGSAGKACSWSEGRQATWSERARSSRPWATRSFIADRRAAASP